MRPLKHGYTNRTVGDATTVRKRYEGPDAEVRLERERAALTRLRSAVPVPPVLAVGDGWLETGFVAGSPGQELMEGDRAAAVLRACGTVLRRIHSAGWTGSGAGAVLVHGDFGPNNLLVDAETFAVTAVVDWEFAHAGEPVEDLAWCEWIVRMHHPDHVDALDAFFGAYGGPVPAWPVRKAAMLERCAELTAWCDRWEPSGAKVRHWEARAAITAAWRA